MTFRGAFVTLLEILLLILAFGTEIEEFLMFAFCVGGMLAYSLISLLLAVLSLTLKSRLNISEIQRLGEVRYTLVLQGVVFLPVIGYMSIKSADFNLDKGRRFSYSFLLAPTFFTNYDFAFQLPSSHIGEWEVGISKLRFEDIFGLFSLPLIRPKKRDYAKNLAVVPNIYDLGDYAQTTTSGGFGSSSYMNAEEGELLGDSRVYMEGDTLKRINWKQTVRTRTLYTRQYEMLEKPRIVIAVDLAVWGEDIGNIIDISAETAISLAKYFIDNGNIVELITLRGKENFNNTIYEIRNSVDIDKMQYAFAGLEFYKNENPLRFSELETSNFLEADKILVINSNPSEEVLSDLNDILKCGKMAFCVKPTSNPQQDEIIEDALIPISKAELIAESVGAVL